MIHMALQVLAAFGGTVGFSLLFGVPVRYYPYCGLIGGIGWLVYVSYIRDFPPGTGSRDLLGGLLYGQQSAVHGIGDGVWRRERGGCHCSGDCVCF